MIERIYLLFEIVSTLLILWVLHGSKKKPGIYTIIYVCLELIIVSMVAEGFISSQYTIIAYLGIAIVDFIEFDDTLKESIVYMIIDCIVMFGLQILGTMAYSLAFHSNRISRVEAIIINCILLCIIIFVFSKIKMQKYIKVFLDMKHFVDGILIILALVLLIIIKNESIQLLMDWNLLIFLVVFTFITVLISVKLIRERYQKNKYIEQLQEYEKYNQVYKEVVSDIRHRQHDFNNHLQALYSILMSTDDLEKIRYEQEEYLNELKQENKTYRLLKENVSSILTAFLYIKFGEIEKQDIIVDYRLVIDQFDKCIPFPDIVELVGNLLDNAVEATKKTDRNIIRFYIEEENGSVKISMENPYDWYEGENFNVYLSDGQSSNGKKRGLGLTNAQSVIARYHGLMEVQFDYFEEKKIIRFVVILPLKKEKH